MRIGIIGVGKLGMPVAVSMALRGHDVMGYDIATANMTKEEFPHLETGPDGREPFLPYLRDSAVRFGTLDDVVAHAEILFVCVQTPHAPEYEGITPLPDTRVDFGYEYLVKSVSDISELVKRVTLVAIVSTVLPGTTERLITPITTRNPNIRLCYNPSFIAMGTVMRDFLDPEFVLIGAHDESAAGELAEFYRSITDQPIRCMSIASAETVKVCYNTFISLKIAFANTVMEVCEVTAGADCDDVMEALKGANRRLISPAYLTPGMGDGGGCHPRDNIAMSWFARERGLSFDFFEAAMKCREAQSRWLCLRLMRESVTNRLPIVILGKAFKPETNIITGSPAVLCGTILQEQGFAFSFADDSVGTEVSESAALSAPAVFLIACRHERYRSLEFPPGSVVIDPHRIVRKSETESFKLYSLGSAWKAR